MSQKWLPAPWPLPENGPPWPGDDERVSYNGLTIQPMPDLEFWDTWENRWEIGLEESGATLLTINAEREQAMAIATRLAEAKEWAGAAGTRWQDLALDPVVLRLMADYPGQIGLPLVEDGDFDDIAPYGPDWARPAEQDREPPAN